MQHRSISNTELSAYPVAIGTGSLGVKMTDKEAFEVLDAYAEAGGNVVDTARVYSDWVPGELHRSERIVGDWLASRGNRDSIILMTKGAHPELGSLDVPRLDPASVRSDLEGSLATLRVDAVDLYWLHRDDPGRPVAEIIDYLLRFVDEGKIRQFGFSNWRAERVREVMEYCRNSRLQAPVATQVLLNIGSRRMRPLSDRTMARYSSDMDTVDRHFGLATFAYSSQAGGYFSKLSTPGRETAAHNSPYDTPENRELGGEISRHARTLRLSVSQIVLGFLLARTHTTIPIIGCRTIDSLHDSLSAVQVKLPDEVYRSLCVKAGFDEFVKSAQ